MSPMRPRRVSVTPVIPVSSSATIAMPRAASPRCFYGTSPEGEGEFCIETQDGIGGIGNDGVPTGQYSIMEVTSSEYILISSECDNGDSPGNLTLEAGDDVTCTFVNGPLVGVPVNNPLALLMLIMTMHATGWYFRPAAMRKF